MLQSRFAGLRGERPVWQSATGRAMWPGPWGGSAPRAYAAPVRRTSSQAAPRGGAG